MRTAAPRPGPTERWSLLRSTAILGAALMAGNAANYLLAVAGSHRLSTAGYGLFSSLLAVLLVGSIPALALQAVVARRTSAEGMAARHALRLGLVVGGISVLAGLAALPGLTAFLHVPDHGVAVAWVLLGLLPLNVLGAVQGHLQGGEEFGRLSGVVLAVGVGRVVGGLVPLLLGAGPATVMAGITAAAFVVAAGVRLAGLGGRTATGPSPGVGPAELLAATLSLGALLLLANLDLLLARHLLPAAAAGRYAAGNVVAKVAFWLPQAVPLTALPRLSRAAGRERALREAAVLTAVVGLLSIVVTAAAGPQLTALTFGAAYRSIGRLAWLFAVQGSALAAVQLLIVDDIANRRRTVVPIALAAAVAETALLLVLGPVRARPLITVAAVTAVLLVAAAAARVRQVSRRRAGSGRQCAASAQLAPTPTDTSSGTSSS